MLQDNPYGYNDPQTSSNLPAADPPNPNQNPVESPGSQAGGTLGGGSYIPPEPPSVPAFTPPPASEPPLMSHIEPPPIINPLNDSASLSVQPDNTSLPPFSKQSSSVKPDLGEKKRKPANKKLALALVAVLLLLGVVGAGAFALMSGIIKNPLAKKTPLPIATAPVPQPTPAPEPQPAPIPAPEPTPPQPPVQSNDDLRVGDIVILASGLNSYSAQHVGKVPSTQKQLIHVNAAATPCLELLAEHFIPSCPQDPAGASAFYGYKSDDTSYELTAKLDDPSCARPGATLTGSICLYKVNVQVPQP